MKRYLTLVLASLLACGCVPQAAKNKRIEFAVNSKNKNAANASAQNALVIFHINQGMTNELNRIKGVLVSQNHLAGDDVAKVAQNYIDYYTSLDELRENTKVEYEKAISLNQEQLELGENYTALSDMATAELEVAKKTADALLNQAFSFLSQQGTTTTPPLPEPTPAVTFGE